MPTLIAIAVLVLAQGGTPERGIRRVLEDQQAAWNRGDVRAFMEGYDDAAAFVGARVTKGSAAILADYQRRYDSREKMGVLEFSDLEVQPLCRNYASVIGRFHLARTAAGGGDTGGLFTLLFRRTAAGWKITLDHTH